MTWTRPRSPASGTTSSGTSVAGSWTGGITAGDLVVVSAFTQTALTSMSATGWNAGPFVTAGSGTSARTGRLFWKIAAGGETSITFTNNTSAAVLWEMESYHEDSGNPIRLSNVAGTDAINATTAAASTTYTTPTVNVEAIERLVVCFGGGRSTGTFSAEVIDGVNIAGGTVEEADANNGASGNEVFYSLIEAAPSSTSVSGSATGSSAVQLNGIAVFVAPSTSTFPLPQPWIQRKVNRAVLGR